MLAMAVVLGLASLAPDLESLGPQAAARVRAERPVAAWIGANLRPQQVARGPLFLAACAYLFLGVAVSVVQRVKAHRFGRRAGARAGAERFRVQREILVGAPPERAKGAARRVLAAARYSVREPADGSPAVEGWKGETGFFGSIAFHVGLLVLLVGAGASSLTRWNGEMLLTEGFPAPFAPSAMHNVSRRDGFPDLSGYELAIRDFVADYSAQGTPVDFAALLSVRRDGVPVREAPVRVNQAFAWRGIQLTLHRYGFAPEIVATDPEGARRVDSVNVLQVLPPGREDAVRIRGGGELRVRLFPDYATLRGEPASRSLRPRQPVIAFRWLEADGRERAAGRVARGQAVADNGYTVAFPALSYWAGFQVSRDAGLAFLAVGSLVGTIGLALRLAFPDQSVRVEWEAWENGTRLRVLASTRFFPALHEEQVGRLVEALERELTDERA
jgi:cytochrome c biogenesis protein ResB